MKKLLTIIAIAFTLNASAQKDSTLNDSTALISIKDLQPVYEALKKMSYEQAAPLIQYLETLVAFRAREYIKPKKQK